MNGEYSVLSKELSKKLGNKEKRENGIYFTPNSIIDDMINNCKKHNKRVYKILEPSCGSCQVINKIDNEWNNVIIHGIESNETIFNSIKTLEFKNNIDLINNDYLKYECNDKYDLIIGNPPYFVIPKKDVRDDYCKYFTGRPNIFLLFIIKALGQLNMNGILAFVLPKNFLNCNYYNELRVYINKNFKIISIKDHSTVKYIGTCQDTITLIIQKKKKSKINLKYVLEFGENLIFNTCHGIKKLRKYYKGATNLKNMKFEVKVGNIVWNQVKDKLTNDETKTRLVYSSDIVDNELGIKQYKNPEKMNFIEKKGNTDLLLVVNRGYGTGKYKFCYCLIDSDKEYLIENHLICIKSLEELERNQLLEKYKLIINSLKSDKTKGFIELYCGNNALNTKELSEVVPIYI
jgi:hypothetical protein